MGRIQHPGYLEKLKNTVCLITSQQDKDKVRKVGPDTASWISAETKEYGLLNNITHFRDIIINNSALKEICLKLNKERVNKLIFLS